VHRSGKQKLTDEEKSGWTEDKQFYIPEEVSDHFGKMKSAFNDYENEWNSQFETYKKKYPLMQKAVKYFSGDFGSEWAEALPSFAKLTQNKLQPAALRKSF